MYPNTSFLDSIPLSKTEFERISKMSSWATCSKKPKQTAGSKEDEEDEDHASQEEEDQTT